MRLIAAAAAAAVVAAILLAALLAVSHRACGATQAAGQIATAGRIHVVGRETGDDGWQGLSGDVTRAGFIGQGDPSGAVPELDGTERLAAWTGRQRRGYVGRENLTQAYQAANRWIPEMLRVDSGCRPIAMMFVENSHTGEAFGFSGYS